MVKILATPDYVQIGEHQILVPIKSCTVGKYETSFYEKAGILARERGIEFDYVFSNGPNHFFARNGLSADSILIKCPRVTTSEVETVPSIYSKHVNIIPEQRDNQGTAVMKNLEEELNALDLEALDAVVQHESMGPRHSNIFYPVSVLVKVSDDYDITIRF
ncbi:hypothetical protein COV20_02430 [Candidatus Woesearchaeota archaeon CG10_big_fil_rev_8_21_14_0_10_45_16]|nr:MAG: hypothetical protein COV20_02430 [Candidatus Woesearchaeota archaeon CG10_big_fil_rev_8_21_14_0_10_45_16]